MSVTIHWRPASDKGKSFENGTSTNLGVLKDVFNNQMEEKDIAALRAMASATNDQFYNEVADTIEKIGAIIIWGVY